MAAHLILGVDGFIGRHLAIELIAAGEQVIGVGRRSSPSAVVSHLGTRRETLDLFQANVDALAGLIARVDVVYHLVWSTIPSTAEFDPARDMADNVGLMIRLLRAVRNTGVRLVFTSSGGTVYGHGSGAPFREDGAVHPIGAYGASKMAAELYAHVARTTYDADVRIARLSNPFGAGQAKSMLQGAVSRFTGLALADQPIQIWGDGQIVRDYLHISDAVAGLRQLAQVDRAVLGPEPVFNIGSGQGTSLITVISLIEDILGRTLDVTHFPGRPFDVATNILDISRAEERLGWRPRLTLRQGIEQMVGDLRRDPDQYFSSRPSDGIPNIQQR